MQKCDLYLKYACDKDEQQFDNIDVLIKSVLSLSTKGVYPKLIVGGHKFSS